MAAESTLNSRAPITVLFSALMKDMLEGTQKPTSALLRVIYSGGYPAPRSWPSSNPWLHPGTDSGHSQSLLIQMLRRNEAQGVIRRANSGEFRSLRERAFQTDCLHVAPRPRGSNFSAGYERSEKALKSRWSPLTVQEGLAYHRRRLYVPVEPCREEVLRLCHESRPAGHFGLFRTLHLILRDFWWPRVRADVEWFVKSCPVCHHAKDPPGKPPRLFQPLPTPTGPWKVVSMDFVTDLAPSAGYTTIFMVVDLFSKMAHFVPCAEVPSAKETACLFVHHVFRLHGWPDGVVSDHGDQFTAHFWCSLLHQLGIKSHLSSAFHPQSDGQTEQTNRTLEQYLRCYVNYQQDDWADLLPLAEFAYNNVVHTATQQTPFRANYGGVLPRRSSRLQGIPPPKTELSEGKDDPPLGSEASEGEGLGVNELVSADAAENAVAGSDRDVDSLPPSHAHFRAEKERERDARPVHIGL
uniref:Gypsy retrotransposon integrase-like protein 1 n=1 Tax=Salvator merianae TaxID=96440 RepID=A0A8D0BYT7_SALMN